MSELFNEEANFFACRPFANEVFNDFKFVSDQYGELAVVICECEKVFVEQKLQNSIVRGESLDDIYNRDPEFFLVLYKAIFEHAKKKPASNPLALMSMEQNIPEYQKQITGE